MPTMPCGAEIFGALEVLGSFRGSVSRMTRHGKAGSGSPVSAMRTPPTSRSWRRPRQVVGPHQHHDVGEAGAVLSIRVATVARGDLHEA